MNQEALISYVYVRAVSIVTGAVDTGAARTALALAILRTSFHHHEGLHKAAKVNMET